MRACAQSSQRATCPPSAAVRQLSIADITLNWPRLTWPALALRHAGPWRRKISARSRDGDIRNLQLWTCQERRALGGWHVLGLFLGLVLLGPQRRQTIQRAHDLTDRVGGDAGVERRGIEL